LRRAAAAGLVAAALAAGCGGSDGAVAHVGTAAITRAELNDAVDHFRQEAQAEGRPFPDAGSTGYRTVQRQALGLLVYRSELVQSADKLGVPVSASEIQSRLSTSEDSENSASFARSTVEAQLAYEHVYDKVTAGVAVAKRGDTMSRWLDRMKLRYEVSYEEGFGPSS